MENQDAVTHTTSWKMQLNERIGISQDKAQRMAVDLNVLLASYQLYYENLRALHWNIRGKHFFELDVKFEELYTDAAMRIDELAERILALGDIPLHTFEDYLRHSDIQSVRHVKDAETAVSTLLQNIGTLLPPARKALYTSEEIRDEGTNSLVSEIIAVLEKNNWMFSAWMG